MAVIRCLSRSVWPAVWLAAIHWCWAFPGQGGAGAQVLPFSPMPDSQFELSGTVELSRADSTVLAKLERVKDYLAERQWDEAVETLRSLMDRSEDTLKAVTEQRQRYVSLRDFVHLQLASLPVEALALYRSRVDPVARQWYEEGVARRDRRLLLNVVQEAFASTWGDDALLALGELSLESGDYSSARWCWERIIPARLPTDAPPTWPAFPDTDLDLAAVRARLVLASILEGCRDRAREETERFAELHPDARGRFGGREVSYVEALRNLLAESAAWPTPADPDWPTFAGSPARNKTAAEPVDVAEVAWRLALRPGDLEAHAPLSFHPAVTGNLVVANTRCRILVIDLRTGEPAWGGPDPNVFPAPPDELLRPSGQLGNVLGQPRFTVTVHAGRLYARMGTAITDRPQQEAGSFRPGYLVCLDLEAQGRLVWQVAPEEGWEFEGSPLADGANVYVGMRRSGVRPQAYVACFDAQTHRLRWRTFICGAPTPAGVAYSQRTHNLLTLEGDTLYYNTNLGAVAAVSASGGNVKWVSLYSRAVRGDLKNLAPHWHRDLNPCVYHHGMLLVAPADSPRILALDAATGQILWQTGTQVEDAVALLGTTEAHLLAGGKRLYWIGLRGENAGRISHRWPDGPEAPGYGRGVLAGGDVLFPTREKICVFDGETARPKKVIDLAPRGVGGGNLLAWRGRLLIATAGELIALRRFPGRGPPESGDVAAVGRNPASGGSGLLP